MNLAVIVICYVTLFALGLADNVRGPLLAEFLAYFKVSDGVGSFIFASSSICGFIAASVSGKILRRMSHLRMLQCSVILMGLSMILMAVVTHFYLFIFSSVLFGLSMGWLGLTQNYLVSANVDDSNRNQILSGLHAMYGLASFFSPLVVAGVARAGLSWSVSLIIVGVLCLLIAGGALMTKNTHRNSSEGKFKPHESADTAADILPADGMWHWIAGSVLATYVMAEILISTRLALYSRRTYDLDLEYSSLMVTYFFIGLLSGRFLFMFYKPKISLAKQLGACVLSSFVLIALGLYFSPYYLVASGFTMAAFYPLTICLISETFPKTLDQAIAKAMTLQSGYVVVMHLSVGILTDLYGIRIAMAFGLLALALCFVFLVAFVHARNRAQAPQKSS